MSNRGNESEHYNPYVRALAGFAIFAVLVIGAAAVHTPVAATPAVAAAGTATSDSPTAYFPAQYVNQATEIEPMPPTF